MSPNNRIDPRVRAYGKARIDVTQRARDESEWQSMWREPRYEFPFSFEKGWKHSIQYLVDDYPAEIGFFIDVLGFPVSAFSPSYAQFTSPGGDFHFSVAQAEGAAATPPELISIQFKIESLAETIEELEKRGVTFDRKPDSVENTVAVATLRSPHGVPIELWGILQAERSAVPIAEDGEDEKSGDFWAVNDEQDGDLLDDERDNEKAETDVIGGDDHISDAEFPEEPVYVDEEDDGSEGNSPIASAPQQRSSTPPRSFPAIIRSSEDLLKNAKLNPARKLKGNGQSGFPNVEDSLDEENG